MYTFVSSAVHFTQLFSKEEFRFCVSLFWIFGFFLFVVFIVVVVAAVFRGIFRAIIQQNPVSILMLTHCAVQTMLKYVYIHFSNVSSH